MGSRDEDVKQYKKSKNKRKKELKDLKNQNKMLYSIAKKTGLRREINKIKKIKAKSCKKRRNDKINSSRNEYDYDSSLYNYSGLNEDRQPADAER